MNFLPTCFKYKYSESISCSIKAIYKTHQKNPKIEKFLGGTAERDLHLLSSASNELSKAALTNYNCNLFQLSLVH